MSKTHISNYGAFGNNLTCYCDYSGFIEYADFFEVEGMTADELDEVIENVSGRYSRDEEAAAAIERANRAIRRWRAKN